MTRMVLEKHCPEKVCVDFLAVMTSGMTDARHVTYCSTYLFVSAAMFKDTPQS